MFVLPDATKRVLESLSSHVKAKGYAPSLRELAAMVGLKSPNTVAYHLAQLKKLGLVESIPHLSRAVRVKEEFLSLGRVPLLGDVPAGNPRMALEEQEGWVDVDASWVAGPSFALRVKGDSMNGAGILPGDVVVVRMQESAEDGDIIVARFEDETTVKYLRRRKDGLYLVAGNPQYSARPLRGGHIVGKVVGVLRKY